jgi:hypothetical protein
MSASTFPNGSVNDLSRLAWQLRILASFRFDDTIGHCGVHWRWHQHLTTTEVAPTRRGDAASHYDQLLANPCEIIARTQERRRSQCCSASARLIAREVTRTKVLIASNRKPIRKRTMNGRAVDDPTRRQSGDLRLTIVPLACRNERASTVNSRLTR